MWCRRRFAACIRWDKLASPDRALGYLQECVLNGCRSVLHRRRLRDLVAAQWERELNARPPVASAETSVISEEQRQAVMEVVRRLPTGSGRLSCCGFNWMSPMRISPRCSASRRSVCAHPLTGHWLRLAGCSGRCHERDGIPGARDALRGTAEKIGWDDIPPLRLPQDSRLAWLPLGHGRRRGIPGLRIVALGAAAACAAAAIIVVALAPGGMNARSRPLRAGPDTAFAGRPARHSFWRWPSRPGRRM